MNIDKQKAFFKSGKTMDVEYRIQSLNKLKLWITLNEKLIEEALYKDLGKAGLESYMSEIGMIQSELSFQLTHIRKWAKKHYVATPLAQFKSVSYEVYEPFGTVLVMAPWNYPFLLTVDPMIGAIAAGNTVVVKPSAYAPNVSAVISKMIKECFDEGHVTAVEGGREQNEELMDMEFDYIFFTGSVNVGRQVMVKAAKRLTPVTLELGGKSPCIIDENCDLKLAVKRILFGKYLNSGQTCVAPDYLLIKKGMEKQFYKYANCMTHKFFGKEPLKSSELPKIINQKHYDRLKNHLLANDFIIGGGFDDEKLLIEPSITSVTDLNSTLMQEEIFGPILPVLTYETLDEAIEIIHQFEKPLALYLFTTDKKVIDKVHREVSFGGGCVNDTIIHLANSRLGFGGTGHSGTGSYHGKKSFETFSHRKSIVNKANWIDLPFRYHPYTNRNKKIIKMFMK